MKHKIFYTMSLLLVAAFILAACGAPAPAKPAATEAPAKAVELTMWTWKVNHVPGLEAVAKDFEAKTGIKVTVTAVNPDDAYRTKLVTSAQSGDHRHYVLLDRWR
jgi:ABC-type glycerol-3-phosphate transport system substrate-binding protein